MAAVLDMLGGAKAVRRSPGSVQEWVEALRQGLPAASALAFKQVMHLTGEELAELLGVSPRTVHRWTTGHARLDLVTGDRLVRAARLFTLACLVLEDEEAAARWMRMPQKALDGGIPLKLAATDVGARAVETLLGRMELGVFT